MSGFFQEGATPVIVSSPGDYRDYSLDWTNVLATGETIEASSWQVSADVGAPTGGDATITAGAITTIWLGGGTDGESYTVGNTVTTSQGRTFDRSFVLQVKADI